MSLSLAKRIYLIVGLVLAGTALVSAVSWINFKQLATASQRLGEVNLNTVATLYDAARLLERQSALANRAPAQNDLKILEKMIQDYDEAGRQLESKLAAVKKLDRQNTWSNQVAAFEAELPGLRQTSTNVFQLSAQFQQAEAVALLQNQVNGLQDRAAGRLGELSQTALQAAQAQPAVIVHGANRANRLILILCLSVLIASTVVAVALVTRQVVRPIKLVADKLAETFESTVRGVQAITQIAQCLAEGASEQAASLEETGASLEEMSSMTKQNAENSLKAKALANQTRQAADVGATDMQAMNQAMQEIKISSADIAKIIKTIDEIAFQTNILALNAAVEAARAGEAGMGFAVVADEVRNLAQRSAQAAKETAEKIEGAIAKTEQGAQVSAKVSLGLQEIVGKVRQVDDLVAEVAAASSEQSQGIAQVNTAVAQMDKVTQSNAASAEEGAGAAQELNTQALISKSAVDELMSLVAGRTVRQAHASVPARTSNKPKAVSKAAPASESKNGKAHPPAALPTGPEKIRHSSDRIGKTPLNDDFKDF